MRDVATSISRTRLKDFFLKFSYYQCEQVELFTSASGPVMYKIKNREAAYRILGRSHLLHAQTESSKNGP